MKRNAYPQATPVYASLLPTLRAVAFEHGYALGLHGSLTTDMDLIACPWVSHAGDPEALIEAMRVAVGGCVFTAKDNDMEWTWSTEKPHGRRAWSIYLGDKPTGPYIDVSVMPRTVFIPGGPLAGPQGGP